MNKLDKIKNQESKRAKGAQSINRACALLRQIFENNDQGIRLHDLAKRTGLHEATARRILKVLESECLVVYNPVSKNYQLGIDLYRFGAAAKQYEIRDRYRPLLERIAEQTEDTVYLLMRIGYDALVIDRIEGSFPVKLTPIKIGQQVPLGVGTASNCLLAWLPEEEREEVIRTNSKRYIQFYNRTPKDVRDQTLMTMERGYTFKENNLIPEAAGVARPIMDGAGRAVAAISVISIMRRFETPRRQEIIELLKREIEAFTTTSSALAGI